MQRFANFSYFCTSFVKLLKKQGCSFKKVSITLILVWIISFYAISQLNIKVGYIGGFTKAPVLNSAVTRFNDDFIKIILMETWMMH
ncbi:MAG: hypothetical protein IPN86_04705 [Saprospiraceae bacterium]|nr:hypothetical protein [Saprospiraceae bacterium]